MLPKPAVRIAVLVDTSTAWGRRLIHGVLSYARVHGPWDMWLEARGQAESLRLPTGWCDDGIIARVTSETMAKHLSEREVPVVNVSGAFEDARASSKVRAFLEGGNCAHLRKINGDPQELRRRRRCPMQKTRASSQKLGIF